MPAFGLDGPWREHVGFAATMEQMAGMSWLTGHEHDQPRIQRGPCDPLAGMHAAFALLVAMAEREHSGRGHFVECSMLEAALNVTAEQVIEYTGYGQLMQRQGNRDQEQELKDADRIVDRTENTANGKKDKKRNKADNPRSASQVS